MRKTILFFSSLLISFLFFTFWNSKVYAQIPTPTCQLSLTQTTFPPDFNGPIKIIGSDGCFVTTGGIKYTVFAYPIKVTDSWKYSEYSVDTMPALTTTSLDNKTTTSITAQLDLTKPILNPIGKLNPGSWIVKVCVANSAVDCGDSSGNVVGGKGIPIAVSAVPTPTPTPIPVNLPKVFVLPNQCIYQIGSTFGVILDNLQIQKNTNYQWWWENEGVFSKSNPIKRTDYTIPVLSFDIPDSETKKIGTRLFCVDVEGIRRCSSGSQNSVTLEFIVNPPPLDGSACVTTSTGGLVSQNISPTPTPTPPAPPCSEWTDLLGTPIPTGDTRIRDASAQKKCASVSTGLGIDIKTDAGALVKSVFGVILSLSGGIALILIIISGYSLIFSQGNPEQVKAAQERLTSAIVGLLFIIFSLVILQIIGADILKIPGFK